MSLLAPTFQMPRVWSVPPAVSSAAGDEAIELAALAGLILDPWEQFVLREGMGERADGRHAAFEVGLVCPRQNGKGAILEARELAGLFLLGERLLIHSAHEFATAGEHFRRLLALIEDCPTLARRLYRVSRAHGEEGIELIGGQRIRFRSRTKGAGRGFSCDCLVYDEAMILDEASVGAMLPTLSARPNPQVWYAGSAVDEQVHGEHGIVFSRIRERGLAGQDPHLAYFEYSVDAANPDAVDAAVASDPEQWQAANPALNVRITEEHVTRELASMDHRTFAVERLGVGAWPDPSLAGGRVISSAQWAKLADPYSTALSPLAIGFDVSPDRSSACIAVSGAAPGGGLHVEVIEHGRGTAWVMPRLAELIDVHKPASIICDSAGPAAALIPRLERQKIKVTLTTARELAGACGRLLDLVNEGQLHHLGQAELTSAIAGAGKRPLVDAWAWSRKSSSADISPLVAATLATWGLENHPRPRYLWSPADALGPDLETPLAELEAREAQAQAADARQAAADDELLALLKGPA